MFNFKSKPVVILVLFSVEGAGGSGNESGLQVTVLPQKKVAALTPSARGRSRGATTTGKAGNLLPLISHLV